MVKIVPTIGRVVLYFPSEQDRQEGVDVFSAEPCCALVVFVHSETLVNLSVFDHAGFQHMRRSVSINVGDIGEGRAEWMDYQLGQAAKAEKAEAALAAARVG